MYCYCVEGRIPFVYCGADSITLESIDNQLIDLHRDDRTAASLEFDACVAVYSGVYAFWTGLKFAFEFLQPDATGSLSNHLIPIGHAGITLFSALHERRGLPIIKKRSRKKPS